jgi:hypothetical protein
MVPGGETPSAWKVPRPKDGRQAARHGVAWSCAGALGMCPRWPLTWLSGQRGGTERRLPAFPAHQTAWRRGGGDVGGITALTPRPHDQTDSPGGEWGRLVAARSVDGRDEKELVHEKATTEKARAGSLFDLYRQRVASVAVGRRVKMSLG